MLNNRIPTPSILIDEDGHSLTRLMNEAGYNYSCVNIAVFIDNDGPLVFAQNGTSFNVGGIDALGIIERFALSQDFTAFIAGHVSMDFLRWIRRRVGTVKKLDKLT